MLIVTQEILTLNVFTWTSDYHFLLGTQRESSVSEISQLTAARARGAPGADAT